MTVSWRKDYEKYPCTEEDINTRRRIYDFNLQGYKCSMRRASSGFWFAIIRIPYDHPYVQNLDAIYLKVHGGITSRSRLSRSILFDCGRGLDISPLCIDRMNEKGVEISKLFRYRDYNFMQREIYSAVKQLEILRY